MTGTVPMKLVMQPRDSALCGQACVAMLTGVTLDEATKLVGTKGKTWSREIRSALASQGFHMADWKHPKHLESGKFYMARLRPRVNGTRHGHWNVIDQEGRRYDPEVPVVNPAMWDGWRLTSIYEITQEDD